MILAMTTRADEDADNDTNDDEKTTSSSSSSSSSDTPGLSQSEATTSSPESSSSPSSSSPPPISPAQRAKMVQQRRLDPLVASLTRMDEATRNAPTVQAPLFGEIPLDGSLVVLIPAAIVGVAGIILSIVIALNSPDAVVASFQTLNTNDPVASSSSSSPTTTTLSLPQPQQPFVVLPPDENGCRGLCSTQEQDLQGLKVFMEGLTGRKVAP